MDAARTLVVHTGGIGDFLLACPSIRALADEGPVELLGRRDRLQLAVAGGIASEAHDLHSVGFHTLFTEPSERLREFLSRFRRAVVWMSDDGVLQTGIERCGVPDVRVYPGLPPQDWREHASTYYTSRLGIALAPPLRLDIPPTEPARDILIHPGSGSPRKNWPLERFEAMAQEFKEEGRAITWCLGPAELESPAFQTWTRSTQDEILTLSSLVELAGALANAALTIGNDSGIIHLAAAVGCPTLALFGPTDPAIWAPIGAQLRRF